MTATAQETFEADLDSHGDSVLIERDPQHTEDDTFDETTGVYTPPAGDTDTVYDGKALISLAGRDRGVVVQEGGGEATRRRYSVSLPKSATGPRKGDLVTVYAVHTGGDEALTDAVMRVAVVDMGSLMMRRRLLCDLVRGGGVG